VGAASDTLPPIRFATRLAAPASQSSLRLAMLGQMLLTVSANDLAEGAVNHHAPFGVSGQALGVLSKSKKALSPDTDRIKDDSPPRMAIN
jgi:hypothetical protein